MKKHDKTWINYNEGGPRKRPSVYLNTNVQGDIRISEMFWSFSEGFTRLTGEISVEPHYRDVTVGKDTRLRVTFLFFWRRWHLVAISFFVPLTGRKKMIYTQEQIKEMQKWKPEPTKNERIKLFVADITTKEYERKVNDKRRTHRNKK